MNLKPPSEGLKLTTWRVPSDESKTRLRRMESVYPKRGHSSPVYSRAKYTLPSRKIITSTGQINPLSAVQAKGNLSPYVLSGNIGFTATSNSITAFWDGSNSSVPIVVKRADKTSFTVPSGAQTISGLQPSTTYGFSVYSNVNNASGLSFGPGDTGDPKVALSPTASTAVINATLQVQQSYNSEPVYAGLVYFTTTASSTAASGAGQTSTGSTYGPVRIRGLQSA